MTRDTSKLVTLPNDHRLRLLLPFFFNRNVLAEAEQIMQLWTQVSAKTWLCWEKPATIPLLYQDETLPTAYSFLFDQESGGCAYLRVPDQTANFWFKNGGIFEKPGQIEPLQMSDRPSVFEVKLAAPGIELFLSPHGAGVFSVTFAPKYCGDLHYQQELNYRLSQVRKFTAYPFRLPHNAQNPNPIPATDVLLPGRLGQAGGAFTLIEWVDFLLKPLQTFGLQIMQQQFFVYSVTRFDMSVNFSNSNVTTNLRPYLAAVTHVEEYHHVGSLQVNEQILNPRHWVAVGSLGTTHLLADQNQPQRDFDEQRLAVALHKYFIPYLLSLLQRITLQSILKQARYILTVGCNDGFESSAYRIEDLRKLNRHTLEFTVNGWFTEVSSREVINQYYAQTQQGLRVQDSFKTLQRALHNAEVIDNDRLQNDTLCKIGEMAERVNRNAGIIAHVQSKVEWLEVFFVSYYATALVYYLSHSEFMGKVYVHISLIFAPFVSGLIAFWMLRPDQLHNQGRQQTTHGDSIGTTHHSNRRSLKFMAILIAVFALWLTVGILMHQGVCHQSPQLTEPPQATSH